MLAQALRCIATWRLSGDTVSYAEARFALAWLHNYICAALPVPKQQLGRSGKIIALAVCKALGARLTAVFGLLQQAAIARSSI